MADLVTAGEAAQMIAAGQLLLIAGASKQLDQLPQGQWIGGSTPYFMAAEGGVVDEERVFVTRLDYPVTSAAVRVYTKDDLQSIPRDYAQNGYSFVILPAGSEAHLRFDRECALWPGLFNSPLIGWNAGVHVSQVLSRLPRVFDGTTRQSFDSAAVVMHTALAPGHIARVEIINAFRQGKGDKLTFRRSGFVVDDCDVNGSPQNFADYIKANHIDIRWPLVADYAGERINVSFQAIDHTSKQVRMYAPLFEGIEYRLADPPQDLAQIFGREFDARQVKPAFSCNCVLNFLYAELEGKRTGAATGPITFGEIAYIQLNQTLVYVTFEASA
ncbi:MAG TPA: hypothetical protein VIV60_07325 [Polyangiaceae bacterium]